MSTIQVEDEVKKELFLIAAELQSKRGRKASINEAIKHLINVYRSGRRDIPRMLSLFGSLGPEPEAHVLLRDVRAGEEEKIGELTRKHCT